MTEPCNTPVPVLWEGGNTYGTPNPRVVKVTVRVNGVLMDIPQGYIIDPCNLPKTSLELDGCEQILTVNTTSISLSSLFECLTVIHGEGTPEDAPTSNQYPLYSDTSTTPPTLWVYVNGVWVDPSNVSGIDCAALVAHCELVTKGNINEVINNFVTGDTLVNLFNELDQTQINSLVDVLLSKDPTNLITDKDGIYYGITAPPEIANLYIDNIAGDDTAVGTRAAPMKTIQTALARGVAGVNRTIWLYEGRNHVVDPANPATLRGGTLRLFPYGPMSDALPPVMGDTKYASETAKNFNTFIVSAARVVNPDGTGTNYQFSPAFYAVQNGNIISSAISYQTAPVIPGVLQSSYSGMLNSRDDPESIVIVWGKIVFADDTGRLLSSESVTPVALTLAHTDLTGAGYIVQGGSRTYTITDSGANTPTDLTTYLGSVPTATKVYSTISTNILPPP